MFLEARIHFLRNVARDGRLTVTHLITRDRHSAHLASIAQVSVTFLNASYVYFLLFVFSVHKVTPMLDESKYYIRRIDIRSRLFIVILQK